MADDCRSGNATVCGSSIKDLQCYMVLNSTFQRAAIAVLSCTVGSLCILENSLVLYIIYSSSNLRRKPSYLFLSSVALADLLASINFTYSFVEFHAFHGTSSPTIFLLKLGCVTASFTASLGSLLLTAFDRHICIHRPSVYRTMVTKKLALLALTVMWGLTIVIAFLPLMGWNCCELNTQCSELFPLIDNKYLAFWISIIWILIFLIVFSYSHILWKARKHVVYMAQQAGQVSGQTRMRMDILLAKTLVLVLSVIMLFWSPVLLLMIYSKVRSLNQNIKRAFAFCSNLCLLNCLVNPIVYALRSWDIRQRILKGVSRIPHLLRFPDHSQDTDNDLKNSPVGTVCDETLCDTDAQ